MKFKISTVLEINGVQFHDHKFWFEVTAKSAKEARKIAVKESEKQFTAMVDSIQKA